MRDEDDGGVERDEVLLEPLERLDVQVVGRLVEEEQVWVAGERPCERAARELAAGEGGEAAVEVAVAEAEAVERAEGAGAPAIAAGMLEAGLHARVAVEDVGFVGRLGHRALQAGELLLERHQVAAAAEHVVAQGEIAFAGRALVVERDAGALLERQLAAVDPRLARDHPQERGLARAVAPGQRHPVSPLELERDAAE